MAVAPVLGPVGGRLDPTSIGAAADAAFTQAVFSFAPPGLVARAGSFRLGEALVAGKVSSHPALRIGDRAYAMQARALPGERAVLAIAHGRPTVIGETVLDPILPPLQLVVCGAGPDAAPLVDHLLAPGPIRARLDDVATREAFDAPPDVVVRELVSLSAAHSKTTIPAALLARPGWAHKPRRLRPWLGGWAAAPVLALAGLLGGGFGAGLAEALRRLSGAELLRNLGPLAPAVEVSVEDFCNISSFRLELETVFGLAKRISEIRADAAISGVV